LSQLLSSLRRDSDGSVAVEFAIVGPVLITMFMGVLQIGVGMQNYNALRGISADVARYAVVNYQTANRLSTSQLQAYASGIASAPPYGLVNNRFQATISTATTQRVAGATEYTVQVTYRVPSVLGIIGIAEIPLTYNRPVFVVNAS
jgi:Flp pilus assembly protein TadG